MKDTITTIALSATATAGGAAAFIYNQTINEWKSVNFVYNISGITA